MHHLPDLSFLHQKVKDNPVVATVGCAITMVGLVYAFSRPSNKSFADADEEFDEQYGIEIDREFNQRFAKIKNRNRSFSGRKGRNKPSPNNNNAHSRNRKDNRRYNNNHLHSQDDDKDDEQMEYSPFDPNNPNYENDQYDDDDDDANSGPEEGFSIDEYYVPFRVVDGGKGTKRRPDGAFRALMSLYSTKESTQNILPPPSNEYEHILHRADSNDNDINAIDVDDMNDIDDSEHDMEIEHNDEHDHDHNNNNNVNMDINASPPLTYVNAEEKIDNHNMSNKENALDSLKERYYKNKLPPSLKPDTMDLKKSFSSTEQQAVKNDINSDDSILGGIQSVKQFLSQNQQ